MAPAAPPPATLWQIADRIDEVIAVGSDNQRKALIETLVAQVKITGPGRVFPVFRIPQQEATSAGPQATESAAGARRGSSYERNGVRALTNLVGLTIQHPNPGGIADAPEISIRAVRERRV
jgi:site-specific DNA recombinase